MKSLVTLLIGLSFLSSLAKADDDRSSPESLIRSLYSAINHHEYARAWSYYGDPPAKDFATYSKGFENPPIERLASFGLVNSCRKSVMDTGVMTRASDYGYACVKFIYVLSRQLLNTGNSQQRKIGQHGFADVTQFRKFFYTGAWHTASMLWPSGS